MTTLKQRLEHWKKHRNNLEAREILEDFADEILRMSDLLRRYRSVTLRLPAGMPVEVVEDLRDLYAEGESL